MLYRGPNIHHGSVLEDEFMEPLKVKGYRLAKDTGVDPKRISDIFNKKQRIAAGTVI